MVRFLAVLLLCSFVFFSIDSYAVSSQQMAAFKKLPASQQAALAKKMGININEFKSPNTNSGLEIDYQAQIKREEDTTFSEDFDTRFEPIVDELKLYGSEVFNNPESTLLSQSISAVPFDYVLAIGDTLNISLYGKESELFELTINSNGKVVIPGITPVTVAGLTFKQASEVVSATVQREKIGTQVTLAIGQIQPIKVFVAGEVSYPGEYVLPPFSNVVSAIGFAGGVSDIASLRNITVRRQNKVVTTFDLYQLLQQGIDGNTALRTGDVVFVPSASKQVAIQGGVKRPAIYEVKEQESYADVIKFAGGFAPSAYKNVIRVKQISGGESAIIKSIEQNKLSKLTPIDGDEIYVDKKSQQAANSVALIGAVSRPGFYQWYEGLSLSELFSNRKSVLLPISDLGYALVVREIKGHIDVFQFEPKYVEKNNFTLFKDDKVIVFSRFELEKNERAMLENYALTQADFENKVNLYKWKNYKKRAFEDYIKPEEENVDLTGESALKQKVIPVELPEVSIKTPIYIEEIFTSETQESLPELAFYSRSNFLPKLLQRLVTQKTGVQGAKIAEISGRVKYPGLYPIPVNGKISDLINAAGGLVEGAYLEQAELSRQFMENEYLSVNNIKIDLDGILSGELAADIPLKGRDYLNVFQIPNWQENISVTLNGEVKLPGKYTIRKGETLKEVIERAGGFSEFADIDAIVFTRESLRLKEREQIKQLADSMKKDLITNNLNSENSILGSSNTSGIDKLIDQLSDIEAVGRLVVDVNAVLNNDINLLLENKDTLYIPSKKQSVNVIGEVFVSTSHLHQESYNVDDYIGLSGGMKDKAATDKVFIIKASGKVVIPNKDSWFAVNTKQSLIQPGDTIVVPLDSQYKDNLTLWTQVTQIVYQLGVAVAAIGSL
ncbi:SLBB domain-containing protein [Pseudoalteromonas spongiae]|uniref:SLBB domain-containing protein n=1 Tax=Pseudoalteromonas spongiae TaxID=298657 RepID=UPI00110C08B4|nr:SLBB domain-containing protein [Pseudoalteromonas spongiae]TMO83610.1 polysaccharide biosynthesis protein [Pseudoalteromonas spongiae]